MLTQDNGERLDPFGGILMSIHMYYMFQLLKYHFRPSFPTENGNLTLYILLMSYYKSYGDLSCKDSGHDL